MNNDSTGCANCGMSVNEMRQTKKARDREAAAAAAAAAEERRRPRSEAAKRGWVTRKKNSS